MTEVLNLKKIDFNYLKLFLKTKIKISSKIVRYFKNKTKALFANHLLNTSSKCDQNQHL